MSFMNVICSNKHTQEPGESVEHFITNVIKLAENCQYGNFKDDLIRDKLVNGVRDVREKLLGMENLNLATAIETLKTTKRMKEMGSLSVEPASLKDDVNLVRQTLKNKRRVQESRLEHPRAKKLQN